MKAWLTSAAFFVSCGISLAQHSIVGLASPVLLQPGQTVIVKSDYFPFETPIDKVQWPKGIKLVKETKETYTIAGKPGMPYDNIRFTVNDSTIDIPCRNSRKTFIRDTIELDTPANRVGIKGTFNAWVVNDTLIKPLGPLPSKVWLLDSMIANEGFHQYKLVVDGREDNPIGKPIVSNGMGGTNVLLKIGEPDAKPPHVSTVKFSDFNIALKTTGATQCFAYWNNELIAQKSVTPIGNVNIPIPMEAHAMERSYIRVYVCNKNKAGNDILIPLRYGKVIEQTSELKRSDLHTQIMYFMMVDRFNNGNLANDPKPLDSVLPKANYMGGDLKGVQDKINEGFFEQMGTNTIWLSPISQNPQGAWGYWNKQVVTKFSAYHGYWPTSYSIVDARFGNNQLFGDVIHDAHGRNMNVVLDFVAHHVHTDHPVYKLHPDWVTSLYLPDGSLNTERWDDYRLTTWFDTFLPTLDLQREEVRELVADSVMFWVRNYDLDGYRHDASKHVPEEFWRLLTKNIKTEQAKKGNAAFYQIGETYGSPELIGSYVNSGQMDAQFDFNLYDAAVGAFTSNTTNEEQAKQWENLQRTLGESFDYYGWHHLMGNISGNQDRPRFASLADGSVKGSEDTKLAGWTRTITNADAKGYTRMAQLMAFNMTMPGVPVIYYGDEYAMPGANDPDNRRMMQFDGYNSMQQKLVEQVKQLTALRKSTMPLLYGEYESVVTDPQFFAYQRNYFGKKVMVVFSKNAGTVTLPIAAGEEWKPLFNHTPVTIDSSLKLDLGNDDVEVFVLN